MAKPSMVTNTIYDETPIVIEFKDEVIRIQPISLKGHSPNQYAYMTPDHIVYLGDALISTEMIEKHPLIFTFDVGEHIKSLNKLRTIEAKGYVIAHGGYFNQINDMIDSNLEALMNTQEIILSAIKNEKLTFDELHRKIAFAYMLTENLSQNLLNRSVIHAHVKYLLDLELIKPEIDQGILYLTK